MDMASMVQEFGLGIAITIGMFTAFWFLLKWVLEVSKEQLANMDKERQKWAEVITGFNNEIANLGANNREFHNSVTEAHKFQREEHKEMIKSLGRINGYKD